MNFTYTNSDCLSLKEFRSLVMEYFEQTQVARASVYQSYKKLSNEPRGFTSEYYDVALMAILSLKNTVQHFSSIFCKPPSLPYSIYSIRHSMIKGLRCIDEQAGNLVFQILALKDSSLISHKRILLQEQTLQRDLERLLQDSDNAIIDMRFLVDQVTFFDNQLV